MGLTYVSECVVVEHAVAERVVHIHCGGRLRWVCVLFLLSARYGAQAALESFRLSYFLHCSSLDDPSISPDSSPVIAVVPWAPSLMEPLDRTGRMLPRVRSSNLGPTASPSTAPPLVAPWEEAKVHSFCVSEDHSAS